MTFKIIAHQYIYIAQVMIILCVIIIREKAWSYLDFYLQRGTIKRRLSEDLIAQEKECK